MKDTSALFAVGAGFVALLLVFVLMFTLATVRPGGPRVIPIVEQTVSSEQAPQKLSGNDVRASVRIAQPDNNILKMNAQVK